MANLLCTDTELTTVASAIRSVTGGSAALGFPTGMKNALDGVTRLAATTYNTSSSDQTITARKLITGNQTIKAVTTSNIDAANIKTGVVVKVGDANSAGRIKNVTGTFTSDANATAGQILSGKTAYVNGSKITGTISSKAAATYNTSTSDQTITSGQYLSGAQTIKAVTTSGISASNIVYGCRVKVGDANNAGRIKNILGTAEPLVETLECNLKLSNGNMPFYLYPNAISEVQADAVVSAVSGYEEWYGRVTGISWTLAVGGSYINILGIKPTSTAETRFTILIENTSADNVCTINANQVFAKMTIKHILFYIGSDT